MAKISELVKTYKLLNDPNAPDWNVKFIGAAVIALALIAAAGAVVWRANTDDAAPEAGFAAEQGAGPEDAPACTAEEIAAELARTGASGIPEGTTLPSGCEVRA